MRRQKQVRVSDRVRDSVRNRVRVGLRLPLTFTPTPTSTPNQIKELIDMWMLQRFKDETIQDQMP